MNSEPLSKFAILHNPERHPRPPTLEKIGSTAATDDLDAPSMPVEYDGSVIMLGRVLCAIGVLALLAIGLATLQW